MTTAIDNASQTGAARGACVLLCDAGDSGGPIPPDAVLQALSARGIRPLPVTEPLLALAMLVRLERETARTPMPVLFIACTQATPPDDLLRAIRSYCPSAVSRRLTDDGRMVPLDIEPASPHKNNGRTPPTPVPGRSPDLRLTGDSPEPKPAPDVEDEDASAEDPASLSDEELSMLLSDDWHRRADGTQS